MARDRFDGNEDDLKLLEPDNTLNRALSWVNTKYVISPRTIESPSLKLVFDSPVKVYENLDVLPRAFLVGRAHFSDNEAEMLKRMQHSTFDPRKEVVLLANSAPVFPDHQNSRDMFGEVIIKRPDPNQLELTATLKSPGLLFVSDIYSPKIQAFVDNRAVKTHRANLAFRAVLLEAGQHNIRFEYRDKLWLPLLWLSVLCIAFCLGTTVLSIKGIRYFQSYKNNNLW